MSVNRFQLVNAIIFAQDSNDRITYNKLLELYFNLLNEEKNMKSPFISFLMDVEIHNPDLLEYIVHTVSNASAF